MNFHWTFSAEYYLLCFHNIQFLYKFYSRLRYNIQQIYQGHPTTAFFKISGKQILPRVFNDLRTAKNF